MPNPLRVILDAQLRPQAGKGGITSVLAGLVAALGELRDGDEEYVIVGPPRDAEWLRPFLGPNQRLVAAPPAVASLPASGLGLAGRVRRKLGTWASTARRVAPPKQPAPAVVPLSDGFYESLGGSVLHFPYQKYVITDIPTVFNPHDLQHRRYPDFFTPDVLAAREAIYGAGCSRARVVVAGSQWIKDDIIRQYGVPPERVQVIPWAPPTEVCPEPDASLLAEVKARYGLPDRFMYYPAVTWPHKNHARLIEAMALLRDRGADPPPLVCSGGDRQPTRGELDDLIRRRRLADRVIFLGLLPLEHVRAVYRLSRFVVVPTLFEAASGPVFEAWREGAPAACSNVTSLPQQAGDAALIFDPLSAESIAEAVRRLDTEDELRESLIRQGRRRLGDFSWERTARAYRAVYRKVADRPLTGEDKDLLSWDWMRDPRRRPEDRT